MWLFLIFTYETDIWASSLCVYETTHAHSSYLFLYTVVFINCILVLRTSDAKKRGQSLSHVVTHCGIHAHASQDNNLSTKTDQIHKSVKQAVKFSTFKSVRFWKCIYTLSLLLKKHISKHKISTTNEKPMKYGLARTNCKSNSELLYLRWWRWPFSTFGTRNMDPRLI